VPFYKPLREKIDQALDDGENLTKLHIHDILKPEGVKAIMEALGDLFYKHLKDIRLWKVEA